MGIISWYYRRKAELERQNFVFNLLGIGYPGCVEALGILLRSQKPKHAENTVTALLRYVQNKNNRFDSIDVAVQTMSLLQQMALNDRGSNMFSSMVSFAKSMEVRFADLEYVCTNGNPIPEMRGKQNLFRMVAHHGSIFLS